MIVLSDISVPTDEVFCKQGDTVAVLGHQDHGCGTLYVAASMLTWSNDSGKGFSLDYTSISVHGVSNDSSVFHRPCIYCMLDLNMPDENGEEQSIGELILSPQDQTSLENIYNAIADCQVLHPDDDDDELDDVEEEDEHDVDDKDGNGNMSVDMPSRQDFENMIQNQPGGNNQPMNVVDDGTHQQKTDGQFDDPDED